MEERKKERKKDPLLSASFGSRLGRRASCPVEILPRDNFATLNAMLTKARTRSHERSFSLTVPFTIL